MAQRVDLARVWQVLDAQVTSGRIPGYVAAVRVGGQEEVRAGGRTSWPGRPSPGWSRSLRVATSGS